jgi:hypothetical protein
MKRKTLLIITAIIALLLTFMLSSCGKEAAPSGNEATLTPGNAATELPATEATATESTATEAPATDSTVTEAPATDVPATELPATDEPATEPPETRVWLGVYNDLSPYGQVTIDGYSSWESSIGGNELTGQNYTVKAEPAAGFKFKEWQDDSGSVVSVSQEFTFTLKHETRLFAIFEEDPDAADTPPSFGTHQVTWEYDEGSYEGHQTSANVGIRLGDRPLPTANKYIKPELTSGDVDAFSFVELTGSNWAEPHEVYNFYVYLEAGLPEGTYSATLTLYYDAAGNGSDWVAVDTCELTAVITKSTQQYFGNCWLGAYNDRSPYGKVTIEGYGYWDTAVGGNEEMGRTFTAKAEPGPGYRFKEWQDADGNVVSTSQDYTFKLEKETMLYVIFEKDPDWVPAPPSFGTHPDQWEYSAGSYMTNDTDVNIGIRLGDYPLPTANMYIKVELTSGNVEAFSFTELNSANYAEPHAQYNFWVYLQEGLGAGTYSATLTLYYDVNGNGSDWVQVDSCELRAVISP